MKACLLPLVAIFTASLALRPAPVPAAVTMNVEVDWLSADDHNHKPTQCEMDAVKGAFANHGITLNIVLDDAIPETAANDTLDFHSPALFDSAAGTWYDIESAWRDHAAGTGWHYCVFGHEYSLDGVAYGSSGLAELPGDEFVVTLASFTPDQRGSPWDRAGTFMHEFGHNLSLTHAGSQDKGLAGKYKPNYPSVMSYRYQLKGVQNGLLCENLAAPPNAAGFLNLDYSNGTLHSLNENSLDECAGIGLGKGVDWSCNGAISPPLPPPPPPPPGCPGVAGLVAADISSGDCWCKETGLKTEITDYDDWSNVSDVAGPAPRILSVPSEPEICPTVQDRLEILNICGFACAQPNPCDEPTPALASLVRAEAEPGRIRLEWYAPLGAGSAITLERSEGGAPWAEIAILASDGTGHLRYEDRAVSPGGRYGYRIRWSEGGNSLVSPESWVEVPRELGLALLGLRPNPASADPIVAFTLPDDSPATLELFDVAGRRVLARAVGGAAGMRLLNLGDERPLASGIYLIRLTQHGKSVALQAVVAR